MIVRAGNMSLGVNLMLGLTRKVVAALDEDFDIEVVEALSNYVGTQPWPASTIGAKVMMTLEEPVYLEPVPLGMWLRMEQYGAAPFGDIVDSELLRFRSGGAD